MTVQGVKTLQEKNVAGIIGPFLMEAEAGKEAEKFKIPLIAFTQKHDFPLQGDYLFANFITPEMQVQSLCNYIFADLGIKKVAILYPDEKYGIRYMELFRDIALEYEAEIVGIESYDGKKTDFTVPIRKITKEFLLASESITPAVSNSEDVNNPDENPYSDGEEDETSLPKRKISTAKTTVDFQALFIPDSPSRINLILPQLSFNDAGGMYLIGTNLWHDEGLLKGIKGYNKKLIIPDGFLDNSQNPITEEFTQKFEALFHHKPQFLEAIAYDTASILFITAMDETVDSRKALRDALRGKRIYEGVTGPTLFDEQGRAHRPLFLITVKNGEFVEITP
jgi:ABC-type branched-subunit amino acid transport system substrate-binding protein